MNGFWVRFITAFAVVLVILGLSLGLSARAAATMTDIQLLGDNIYFDRNLSEPAGQACADCHLPRVGFDDPDDMLPVSEGVIAGLYGGRNSPISAYAMYSPIRYFDAAAGLWTGGMFWDGRASGAVLGDPLADQATGPFMAGVEMANTAKYQVVRDVALSAYSSLFQQVWGYTASEMSALASATSDTPAVLLAYDRVALSIAAFERTSFFGRFNSKYDNYLQNCLKTGGTMNDCATGVGPAAASAGAIFSASEWNGLQLFMGDKTTCSACHSAEWTQVDSYGGLPVASPAWAPVGFVPPVFTTHTYDNIGLPVNPAIAALIGTQDPDLGLGAVTGDPADNGKFRVMTLRDIALSKPYGHSGYFTTLKDIVHFKNTRDVADWPEPEIPETVNVDELGNFGLTDAEENDLVAFLATLSDGHKKR